jgi:hypothetical protein
MKKSAGCVALVFYALASVNGAFAKAPEKSSTTVSPTQFVQSFYDWYVVKKGKADADIKGTQAVLKQKSSLLDAPLYKLLVDDDKASAKSPGEIVGLDFDPFVAANGLIYDKYKAGPAVHKGLTYRVPVYGITSGKATSKAVVEAEVGGTNQHYVFTNFHYEKSNIPENENLLSVLRVLQKSRH